ncbi:MAG TPA: Uma2 family endonuclease [Micromonosporaceae bacterium]
MSEPLVLRDRRWSVDDLDELPTDDGNRYEIIDGVLVVSGAPRMRHQRAVGRLYRLLGDACPAELEVFVAPFGVLLRFDTMIMPDILVARVDDLTEGELPAPPVLAVEVLSPGSRTIDLEMKFKRFERAGTPSYWVVDPDESPAKARLIAWDLDAAGRYQRVGEVLGDEAFEAKLPYRVRVAPADLVR